MSTGCQGAGRAGRIGPENRTTVPPVIRFVATVCVIGALAGCSRPASDARSAGSSAPALILVRGVGPDPDSLDPQKARGSEAQSIVRDLCEGLTTLDTQADAAPGVANSWSVSADGRTWTFKLRPEARWSNGDRVVAADFVAGLQRLVNPATASAYAQYIDVIANTNDIVTGKKPPQSLGVAAPDDATVVVTLSSPALYLPALLSHPSTCPVHRPTLARYPDGFARPGVMVSDGAFVLKEWVQGSYLLAMRNHYYWNDAATRLDGVKYLPIPDENAELARYRGWELQVTMVAPLVGKGTIAFDVFRSTVTQRFVPAGSTTMTDGKLTLPLQPGELVTLIGK
jgi:oligopeptide transport system substrate-binding protein